ncbi:glycerate dehydrogenase [Lentithecium fluviatile CBS 122367]|uniref:Glycerate dehydrogenase n=1 Tax=Lentithecium fluviatile CBS 122367 TaxID=1168545 RepID=A0A6G1J0W6_9PLEO|nr:glycerate dehydrogenase [Lentithecium fluviatile CBS 122367]
MHHEIVALERIHQPLPTTFTFPASTTYTLTSHDTTPTRELLHARIRNATIIIVTTIKLDAETLSADVTPALRLVAVMATGTDPVDLEACQKRGIRVTNAPAANLDAVSEHAISLYFAARRQTVLMDGLTREVPSKWKRDGSLNRYMRFADGQPPLTCKDETMGVVGYGQLGKSIAGLGSALGMEVLIAARKTVTVPSSDDVLPTTKPEEGRVPFDEVLRRSTVIVLAIPRNPQTLRLLSTPEFAQMSPYAVLVNIARGGIVDEAAVVQALKDGQIAGYATDVFEQEPAEGAEDSPLLSEEAKRLNITVTPHLAWFSQRTLSNLGRILGNTVEAWVSGQAINIIV